LILSKIVQDGLKEMLNNDNEPKERVQADPDAVGVLGRLQVVCQLFESLLLVFN